MVEARNHLPPRVASQEKPTWLQPLRGSPAQEKRLPGVATSSEASKSLLTKGSKEADGQKGRKWLLVGGGAGAPSPGQDERGTGKGHRWTGQGRGEVTGCGHRVSQPLPVAQRMNLMAFLLQYPPFYSPNQQPALNPALGEHPESVCQSTECMDE